MFQRVLIIINPASGRNEAILNTLNDVFEGQEVDWDVRITHQSGDGAVHARQACEAGYDLVMAYGGDGTLLDVAEGLLGSDVPLGVLPGGTGNALADELNIPPRLADAAAIAVAEHNTIRSIDVGKTGQRHFLLRIGTGMIARLSESVTREMKNTYGIAAYIIGGITAMSQPQFVKYRLTIDDNAIETEGMACLITNSNAIGALGFRLSKHIQIDDGLLDVFILNNDLRTMLAVAGSIAQIDNPPPALEHWQGRTIRVEADPSQGIYGDGENAPFDTTPSTAEVLPGALRVLVPGNPDETS